jgi:Holliday junction resolvase
MAKKGSAEERDLVHKLWDRNFAAMRAPASGGATKKPLPDVIAGNGKIYLAIEVKTTTKDKIYIDHPQIDALVEFSQTFGANPYLGVKFKYTKWFFLSPDLIEKTKNGNYKVEKNFAYIYYDISNFDKILICLINSNRLHKYIL